LNPAGGNERAKRVANWINGDFARLLNAAGLDIRDSKVTPNTLSDLLDQIESGAISGSTAKDVFEKVFESGRPPREIVEEAGLGRIESLDEVAAAIDRAVQDNPKAVEDYRGGKESAIKFLVGQVMRETKGRAQPEMIFEALKEKLDGKA
jgi:aspartyl-tRNA(Asn)/glutamyl-tRNA(Gln) amidotransferase subunit B